MDYDEYDGPPKPRFVPGRRYAGTLQTTLVSELDEKETVAKTKSSSKQVPKTPRTKPSAVRVIPDKELTEDHIQFDRFGSESYVDLSTAQLVFRQGLIKNKSSFKASLYEDAIKALRASGVEEYQILTGSVVWYGTIPGRLDLRVFVRVTFKLFQRHFTLPKTFKLRRIR